MGEKTVNVRIRFPESLKERVQAFADGDRRSLNSEVLTLLEEAMNAREARHTTALTSDVPYRDPSMPRRYKSAPAPAP